MRVGRGPSMSFHRQIEVNGIQVDEGLAELLGLAWKRGIKTTNSCQENTPGIAWIEFETTGDAARFLDIVAKYPKDIENITKPWETMYGRIDGWVDGKDAWQYNAIPYNVGVAQKLVGEEVVSTYKGYNRFNFWASIRFPMTDIPEIVANLR